ncbi:MAG TPA: AMP-binding protein [Acidimicrobiales bacterium]|nr:AMP-binding protein [Acidimicrobiales bacterium]
MTTPRLVALDASGTPDFVDRLRSIWSDGDAAFPVDPRLPGPAREHLLVTMGVNDPVEPGDALVMATSGSTGEPKGVVLTHDAVAASAEATSHRLGVDPTRHHWLACLPLAHVGGLSVVTRALHTDTPLTVQPGFDAEAVTRAAVIGCTHVSLVATALQRIDGSMFECIVLGGSAPPPDRPANTVATYGMTETGSGIVYDGMPLDGVEVRADEDGQLWIRGPMLLRCYRDGVDPKDAEGWFRTGDLGEVRQDGSISVSGRAGDLIITGGENVWPDPVERRLREHPQLDDAAVFGRPDPEWGERVVALIVGDNPPTLDDLRDWVRAELPPHAVPKSIERVDTIPRTALGKLRRAELT